MKKAIILAIICTLTVFGLVGCKSNEAQSFKYDASNITKIEVETGGNSVSIKRISGDSIEVSYNDNIAVAKEGTLKINVPMPNAGVNIKNQRDVIISVPDKMFDIIQIQTEAGSVDVDDINTNKLTVNAQHGDVTISGLEGHITAKTEMGSIKTDLPIGNEIKSLDPAGQTLNSQMGTSESQVDLHTNIGEIEIE